MIINMIIVGVVTLFVSLTGFYKELLIGSTYGLSEFLDTFALAILIPSFIQNVFVGAIKNIFIPNYIAEQNSSRNVQEFQLLVLGIITAIVLVFLSLVLIFNTYLLRILFPNHTESYYELIATQLHLVLPCLFFWGYNGFLNAILEIENKFLYTSIGPVFTSIVTIINVVFFKDLFGDKVLAASILIGSLLGFLYALFGAYYFKTIKIRKIKLFRINDNMLLMIRQIPAKTISGILTGINPFIDQIFAAQLTVGSLTALNYGNKVPAFGVSIAMVAIGNVLLPHFSKSVATNLINAYKELYKIVIGLLAVTLIAIIILTFFSYDIIYYLFERGEFSNEDTQIVSEIQKIFFFRVPFFICTLILVKFLTSINKNNFMAWISFINLVVNLILNIVFVKLYGVYGIALSTTCVLITSCLIYFVYTYRTYTKLKKYG